MSKLFLLFLIVAIISCNNSSEKTATENVQSVDSTTAKYTWASDDEKEFLAGCVENAKANMSDTAAYAQCKCVLNQLKQVFPTMDSAANVLSDSATAATYVSKCK